MLANLRHLRIIEAIAKSGNMTVAADELNVSQPAVSQAVSKTERQLGVDIFIRSNSGMELTACGHILVRRIGRARKFLSDADAAVHEAVGSRRNLRSVGPVSGRATRTQLESLIAVTRADGFKGASLAQGASQQSLHRAVRHLEAEIGSELVVRSGRVVEATPLAQDICRFVQLAFAELEYAEDELAEYVGGRMRRLTIGSLPLGRNFIVPRAINIFANSHPDTRIRLVDGPYEEQLSALRCGDLDLIFGALRDSVTADLVQRMLFQDDLAIVVGAGHPILAAGEVTTRDLFGLSWVVPHQYVPARSQFDAYFQRECGRSPDSIIECSSAMATRELLLGAHRATMTSKLQLQREIESGLLVRLVDKVEGTRRAIGITMRADWEPTPERRAFLDLLASIASGLNFA
jgi:DNA-binding transcriptional LysR family regulator